MTDSPLTPEEQAKLAWDGAVSLLKRSGIAERQARSLFGRLLKANGLQAHQMLAAVQLADRICTGDPASYLTAAAQGIAERAQDPALRADWT